MGETRGETEGWRPSKFEYPPRFFPGWLAEESGEGERGMVDGTVFEVSYFELMRRARVHAALKTAKAARRKGITSACVYIYIVLDERGGLARERAPLCKNYSGRKMSRISGVRLRNGKM